MSALYENMVKRVRDIHWFAHCGQPSQLVAGDWKLRQVPVEQARERVREDVWFDLIQAAIGDLQGFVFDRARAQHRRWNDYNNGVRAALESTFEGGKRAFDGTGVPAEAFALTELQLVVACMEARFAPLNPPIFFERLVEIYETGHLPCGWLGRVASDAEAQQPPVAGCMQDAEVTYL